MNFILELLHLLNVTLISLFTKRIRFVTAGALCQHFEQQWQDISSLIYAECIAASGACTQSTPHLRSDKCQLQSVYFLYFLFTYELPQRIFLKPLR